MKYIFGPVRSRRLGASLGINLTPCKTCSYNCIYCQLGRTNLRTTQRKEYTAVQDVIKELTSWLENNPQQIQALNYITLSGSGEPTLNQNLSGLIRQIKQISAVPVAVITNASLLGDPLVRHELMEADLIVPSLDAVRQDVFVKIDRPDQSIEVAGIIRGLIALRKEFKGKIWLEVMLVRGVNDDLRLIRKLKEAIEMINPDRIQLNSPVRSTAEPDVMAVDRKKLEKIRQILGEKCEVI